MGLEPHLGWRPEVAVDWPHPWLSTHPVTPSDAQLPLLSELLCILPREREGTRSRERVYVECLAPDAMQSMEWRRVRPRA
jgi:hypothetical protein